MSEICELIDGRRIRFNLKRRERDNYYFVSFRGADGRRREPSTKESNKRRAQESAIAIIKRTYLPEVVPCKSLTWDESVAVMVRHMNASGLRKGSIQQYELVVKNLRKVFPDSEGPSDITPAMAEEFKLKRVEAKKAPRTVEGNLGNLSILYNWLKNDCKLVSSNPFDGIRPPKTDKQTPRVVTVDEQKKLFSWLSRRWNKWRLPILFLEVKASIGCRIGELARLTANNLEDGHLRFTSDTTKGRKERVCWLPTPLYNELKTVAGPRFVFEAFADQLRKAHTNRGRLNHAKVVKNFSPSQLVNWLQAEAQAYFEKTGATYFKLHNLRGTAMSRARMSGVTESDAAIAFGCSPQTMRQHYLALDEKEIADSVFKRMQSGVKVG